MPLPTFQYLITLVEDLDISQCRSVLSTEVIAAGCGTESPYPTLIGKAKIAIGTAATGAKVGVKVVTAAKSGAEAKMAILVVGPCICSGWNVFEVVGQGKQEVATVSRITGMIPLASGVSTNFFAVGQGDYRDGGALVITLAVKC